MANGGSYRRLGDSDGRTGPQIVPTRKQQRLPGRLRVFARQAPKQWVSSRTLCSLSANALVMLCAAIYLCNTCFGGPRNLREVLHSSQMIDGEPENRRSVQKIADDVQLAKRTSEQSGPYRLDSAVETQRREGMLSRRADWDGNTPEWCQKLLAEPIPNQAIPGHHVKRSRCGRRTDTGECYDGTQVTFFSQHHQDAYLYLRHFQFLRRPGVYLDVAANNPIQISNSFFFDRCLGWHGICVEANPKYFGGLLSQRSCQLVPTCVSSKSRSMPFRLDGAVGGIEHTLNRNKKSNNTGTVVKLSCVTLDSILERVAITEVDYLSLDVEGHELDVLRGVDLTKVLIKVITLEAAKNRAAADYLQSHGYVEHRPKSVEEGARKGEEYNLLFKFDSIYLHPSVELGQPN